MKGETTEDDMRAIGALATVHRHIEKPPLVIVTDLEKALKSAFKRQ